ncbi:SRPBCC family protein [Frigoriflavimonas asaccharolytica]|uniref:Ligand-binding SRPBCC domain-containing protein n=1 Tax=Frigoriflavimonas asaccharolytica TaxID=2735899 RepID=A0A8J8KAY3_9FLAO|nr:SRPBCC family protein [Frigoriflavimonas asaccharolytica]NRS91969.1 ligand-binding SRPBCC domain-containing protein [Frigoriflavimonas asaccharolytica]
MPTIHLTTSIKAAKEIVFDLSRSVDLHLLSTQKTNEKAIAGKTAGLLELNDTVTWRAKHLGFYQNLSTKITAFDSPNYFADEMLKGAFKGFKHEHFFKTSENLTVMSDIFSYQSPFGILGKLVDLLFLKKYMTRFLLERNLMIKSCAENGNWKQILHSK